MNETIQIREVHWEPLSLYQKANIKSKSQLALLGYMTKNGYLRNPIYGGAFSLLKEFESCVCIPIIVQNTDDETAKEIYEIANKAKLGIYDRFALTIGFIKEAKLSLESEMKGGKGK